ncbi:MAG: D-alanine--D-alanine ligase [Clostridia bacterium]|nr:D-alanine--D-alanine ligase [Clostridia bacterium]
MKIVVLAGGLSPERNVSLSSGTKIAEALRSKGHRVALLDMFFGLENWPKTPDEIYDAPIPESWRRVAHETPDLDEVKAVRKDSSPSQFGPGVLKLCTEADAVFLALHGACGEDGRVQAAFDLLGIPYTGSGCLGSAVAMDKDMTKKLIRDTGVLTPGWRVVTYCADDIETLVKSIELPVVVKPMDSGSSIGVSIAHDSLELRGALKVGLRFGGKVIVEQYIQGRELQVGVLEGRALPSIEIVPKKGFYDYENKYQPGAAEELCPAPIPEETEEALRFAALTVHNLLGLAVYSRSDFIVTQDGKAWFLEINTLPGMTPTSLLPQEAAAVGVEYPELCERILMASLEERKRS